MKKKIKFRVWNIEDQCWDDPSLLEVWDRSGILKHLYDYQGEKTVIQQFVGIKDKNGIDIYEGDLVKRDDGVVFIVEESVGCFIFRNKKNGSDNSKGFETWESYFSTEMFENQCLLTVVGNIFEHTL